MKKLFFILSLFIVGNSTAQFAGLVENRPILFVFIGESNAGGIGSNASATPGELSVHDSVSILNNFTFQLESLDIGFNNLLGHYNLESYWYNSHGGELGLSNIVDSGYFGDTHIYLVKCGQGGTKIENWGVGLTYTYSGGTVNPWDTATRRIDSAISKIEAIEGLSPTIVVMYSQGINDAIGGTPTATWKSSTITFQSLIRDTYGEAIQIWMTELPPTYSTYNVTLAQIISETPNNYEISTAGASMVDINHWDYSGWKQIMDTFIFAYLGL